MFICNINLKADLGHLPLSVKTYKVCIIKGWQLHAFSP